MTADNSQRSRRKFKNLLLAPKAQFRAALGMFVIGFLFISVLFGAMLYRVNEMMNTLVMMSADPEQAAGATSNTGFLLWTTYGTLILSFLCATLFLALTITHRYLGPMVAIQRHVKMLIEGDYSGTITLRKGDLFQDLANDLNELTTKLKTR